MPLNILLDPGHIRPLYQQIIDEVRRAVVRGDLRPDECLPSVRELSTSLGVNPSTVRQAFQVMEREGLVYFQRGTGTFVSAAVQRHREVEKIADQVAEEAVRNAHRSGIIVDDLVEALLRLDRERTAMAGGRSTEARSRSARR